MLIVTKYEEIYPPLLKDFAYISENNCDAEMILEMEKKILFANNQLRKPAIRIFSSTLSTEY